jgi:protein phosphatase
LAADVHDAPVTTLVLPDPCLVLLVGAAGSGKSTLAARLFAPDEVLSSDAYRERMSGDAGDQGATGAAFRALHRDLGARLRSGRTAVVDATSVQRHARRPLVQMAREAAAVPVVAIVLDLPEDLVLARNAARTRVVPQDAVRRQLAALRKALTPGRLEAEGFAQVVVLGSPAEVAALELNRARRPA